MSDRDPLDPVSQEPTQPEEQPAPPPTYTPAPPPPAATQPVGAPVAAAKPDVAKRAIAAIIDGAIAGVLGYVPVVGWIASVL